jgi:hypothetical protein
MNLVGNSRNTTKCLIPFILAVLAGCTSAPTVSEQNFGSSVRNMIELQTARANEKGHGLDGQKAEVILDMYRSDVAKPKEVERDIIEINLGK